jgi:hypothetical protein
MQEGGSQQSNHHATIAGLQIFGVLDSNNTVPSALSPFTYTKKLLSWSVCSGCAIDTLQHYDSSGLGGGSGLAAQSLFMCYSPLGSTSSRVNTWPYTHHIFQHTLPAQNNAPAVRWLVLKPPTFVLFCNDAKLFPDDYKKFIERQFRWVLLSLVGFWVLSGAAGS